MHSAAVSGVLGCTLPSFNGTPFFDLALQKSRQDASESFSTPFLHSIEFSTFFLRVFYSFYENFMMQLH